MGKVKGSGPLGQSYKKIAGRGTAPSLAIARQMVTSSQPPAAAQRSIINYAKNTPADASGKGQIGLNIFSMGRNK
jgi:hypothetical protein